MKHRESIASRLSTTVALIMVVATLFISVVIYVRAYRMVSGEMKESAVSQMRLVVADIGDAAHKAANTCEEAAALASQVLAIGTTDSTLLENIVQTTLMLHPELSQCNISLARECFSPCATRDSDGIVQIVDLAASEPDYARRAWFRQVKSSWDPGWIDHLEGEQAPCSYAYPLFSADSTFLGVVGIELSHGWLDSLTRRIRIFEHAYCLVLSNNGACINNPDINTLLDETSRPHAAQLQANILAQVAAHAHSGKSGTFTIKRHDFRATCFFLPIPSTGWEIALITPLTDTYSVFESYFFFTLLLILALTIIIVAMVRMAVRRATAPLNAFARMARKVAVGEFDAQLPEQSDKSEMADLYESFGFMQQSLARNIEQLKHTTAEQERLESEFHIARKIQLDLVPNIFPAFPDRTDIDIHAVINPWRENGGNLYDFGIADGKILFCIGDVAGNGIYAAIFMSTTFKLLHTSLYNHASPAQALSFANKTMALHNESDMFVTLFFGALDLETGTLTYCSAGQDDPLIVSPDGNVSPLDVSPNVPVGLMEETEYEEQQTTIQPGSMIVLYTDGVVEAQNHSGDLYGVDRLMRRLARHTESTCQQTVEAIREDVRDFSHADSQDDCTALAIRWRP